MTSELGPSVKFYGVSILSEPESITETFLCLHVGRLQKQRTSSCVKWFHMGPWTMWDDQ